MSDSVIRPRFAARYLLLNILVIITALGGISCRKPQSSAIRIRYGITPYQDSALPVVPAKLGWYKTENLDVELVPATWGDVVSAISGGAIDVAIYNFNSFQAPYQNASQGTRRPVFYCPLYLFKGEAIIVRRSAGLTPFVEHPGEPAAERDKRIGEVASQLRSKRIAVTAGTELEQIVLLALAKGELRKSDVTLIHASPEDALAAFLAGNIDAFAAGLTERVEALRHGGAELLVASDLMMPVIDGIITSESFAREHPEVLNKLVVMWFRTIQYMGEDISTRSEPIRSYLAESASTQYSADEYKIAWTFNVFPRNPAEAQKLFSNPESPSFWKTAWDANNKFLMNQHKITSPVPYSAYWGDQILQLLVAIPTPSGAK